MLTSPRRVRMALLAGLLGLSLVPLAAASADQSVVIRGNDFPDVNHLGDSLFNCSDAEAPPPGTDGTAPSYLFIRDSKTVPPVLGTSSYAIGQVSGDQPTGLEPGAGDGAYFDTPHLTQDTRFQTSFYGVTSTTAAAQVFYQPDTTTTSASALIWIGQADLSLPGATWTALDATTPTYTWKQYDQQGRSYTGVTATASTLATFLSAHPATGTGAGEGALQLAGGCDGTLTFFDKVAAGTTGSVTTYDLERGQSFIKLTTSTHAVKAGQPVKIAGNVTSNDGSKIVGSALHLQAKPAGASTYKTIATVTTTDQGGDAVATVHPTVTTAYRFVYDASQPAAGSTSKPVTVTVARVVTAKLTKPTAKVGAKFQVTGTTSPAAAGVVATLWRVKGSGKVKLGTAVIRANGKYAVIGKAGTAPGTWKVFVTVAATKSNTAGTSSKVSLRITSK